jgi:hypothetical protein
MPFREILEEPAERAPKRKRGAGKGGKFFVLVPADWQRLYAVQSANRLNLALAYLVLLAGTGADHRLTKWSTTAVSGYTGMRKEAARTAIAELVAHKFAQRATTWTPAKPHHIMTACKSDADPIFLPVALVTGLTGADTPMLCRVRETGDPLVLRLLIDLYGAVTTDAPYAVSIAAMRGYHDKGEPAEKALEVGAHAIWDLASLTATQSLTLDRARYVKKGEERNKAFWDRVELLNKLGATYREPWLCSSADDDADPIFPLTAEAKVGTFADTAARTLLVGCENEREWKSEMHEGPLVALPAHYRPPAILWLTKMRIEADTPGRRGAYGERERIIAHWIEQYARLDAEAASRVFSNPLRTQPSRLLSVERPHQGPQGDQGCQITAELWSSLVKSTPNCRLAPADEW